MTRLLGLTAILPAAATCYFFVFWRWFDFWRRHRASTYCMIFGTFAALAAGAWWFGDFVFGYSLLLPVAARWVGFLLITVATAFGLVADRQIGFRVRSFTPFFEADGKLRLETRGAYGVVRHPIYAAGLGYQIGVFLVTGYASVLVATLTFGLGAIWFTRQEEQRLVRLLADPNEYERYRQRVPGLIPWKRKREPRAERGPDAGERRKP